MKTMICLTAPVLSFAPALAPAQGCNCGKKEQQAMSCAAGTTHAVST